MRPPEKRNGPAGAPSRSSSTEEVDRYFLFLLTFRAAFRTTLFAAGFLFFAAFLFGAISASVLGFVTRGRVSEADGSDARQVLSTNRPEIDAEVREHC
jgi:hypothetical protein